MDPHDPNYGSHPSQSIPDAAYPEDSPYRPGQHGSGTPLGGNSSHPTMTITPVSSHQTYTPSQSTDPYSGISPFTNHQTPAISNSAPWDANDPRAQVIPSSPPPPYDPNRIPATYSPLGDSNNNLTQTHSHSHPVSDPRIQPTPPGSTHYPPSPQSSQSPYPPPSPNPYSAGSSIENGPPKLGPVAEARRRKKRKMHICIVALCAIFLFIVALIVGVALGVLKVQVSDNNHHGGGPQNNTED